MTVPSGRRAGDHRLTAAVERATTYRVKMGKASTRIKIDILLRFLRSCPTVDGLSLLGFEFVFFGPTLLSSPQHAAKMSATAYAAAGEDSAWVAVHDCCERAIVGIRGRRWRRPQTGRHSEAAHDILSDL